MFIRYKNVTALLILVTLLLGSCTSSKPPISEARKNYLAHDYSRAFNETLKLATHGNAEAQYALGYMYYYGLGVARDQDIARVWIYRSANQQYRPAILAMKKIYAVRGNQYFQSLN